MRLDELPCLRSVPWVQIGLGLAVIAAVAWVVYLVGQRVSALQAARRAEAELREAEDLRRRREARMPGASPGHPIEVASAAVIEPRAASLPCPRCGSPAHVDEHAVETHGEQRLRATRMRCGTCGHQRSIYFVVRTSGIEPAPSRAQASGSYSNGSMSSLERTDDEQLVPPSPPQKS
jgi:hypothetical protein